MRRPAIYLPGFKSKIVRVGEILAILGASHILSSLGTLLDPLQ